MEKVYKPMKNYEYVIEASRSWLKIPVADIIHYRDLLLLLIRRDIVSRYKQTILGPLWFVEEVWTPPPKDVVCPLGNDTFVPHLFYFVCESVIVDEFGVTKYGWCDTKKFLYFFLKTRSNCLKRA